jgi:hypothetical protein
VIDWRIEEEVAGEGKPSFREKCAEVDLKKDGWQNSKRLGGGWQL